MFLVVAAQLGWPIYQFDVKSEFLNDELEEEVYVTQPEGFVIKGEADEVYRLRKALYGLKQLRGHGTVKSTLISGRMDLKEAIMRQPYM